MNKEFLNIIIVLGLFAALSGCSTVPVEQLRKQYEPPILSATQVKSMIRVEVTTTEPGAVDEEETLVAAAN